GQPGLAAENPGTSVAEWAGVGAVEGRSRENESTPKGVQDRLSPPKTPGLPEPPPPRELPLPAAPGGPATGTVACDGLPSRPLALADAIALAFQLQPRLRSALESIEQAARRQDIVQAAFLPVAATGYHVGGFHLNVGGEGIPLGQAGQQLAQAFT